MKKNFIAILMVAAVILILAGCGTQKNNTKNSKSPYIGGTQGIVSEFQDMGIYEEKSNMNVIYENETFPIDIILRNKGEKKIDSGKVKVTLKGIDLASFTGVVPGGMQTSTEAVEGISDVNKEGGETTLSFATGENSLKYNYPVQGKSYDLAIYAETIYEYTTSVNIPNVCFKQDSRDTTICEVEEKKDIFSSGAPIQAKTAEEKRAGSDLIAVEIEIENVGGGDVAAIGEEFNPRFDKLTFKVTSHPDKWSCKSTGKENIAKLDDNGKALIICKLKSPMAKGDLYTQQLDLELNYQYKTLIQESVRIKKGD